MRATMLNRERPSSCVSGSLLPRVLTSSRLAAVEQRWAALQMNELAGAIKLLSERAAQAEARFNMHLSGIKAAEAKIAKLAHRCTEQKREDMKQHQAQSSRSHARAKAIDVQVAELHRRFDDQRRHVEAPRSAGQSKAPDAQRYERMRSCISSRRHAILLQRRLKLEAPQVRVESNESDEDEEESAQASQVIAADIAQSGDKARTREAPHPRPAAYHSLGPELAPERSGRGPPETRAG